MLLVLVAGAWLASQACVLLLQAAHAHGKADALDRGEALYAWAFTDRSALVGPGSEGMPDASFSPEGLRPAPSTPVLDLSLALEGRQVPLDVLRRARLRLATAEPVTVFLLAAAAPGGTASEVAVQAIAPPGGVIDLDLRDTVRRAGLLRLRVQREAHGELTLGALELLPASNACREATDCVAPVERIELAVQPTPERFLAHRDQMVREHPLAIAAPRGVPAPLATAIAAVRQSPLLPAIALMLATGVLAWALLARRHGTVGRPRQLAVLFAVPVALLALGEPAGDGIAAQLAFLAFCIAALVHPGSRHDWSWLGGAAAWRSAARITLAGLGVLAVLLAVDLLDGDGHSAAAWRAERLPRYLAWAVLQQALLLVAISPRMAQLTPGRGTAALAAGAVFALLHLPNFTLMVATLLAGAAWSRSGQRHGALLPLALSHWLLGTVLLVTAPDWLLRSAEIGGRYLMPGG